MFPESLSYDDFTDLLSVEMDDVDSSTIEASIKSVKRCYKNMFKMLDALDLEELEDASVWIFENLVKWENGEGEGIEAKDRRLLQNDLVDVCRSLKRVCYRIDRGYYGIRN